MADRRCLYLASPCGRWRRPPLRPSRLVGDTLRFSDLDHLRLTATDAQIQAKLSWILKGRLHGVGRSFAALCTGGSFSLG